MADDSIGALWIKQGGKGEYMTGNVEIDGTKIPVVVFRNDRKEPGSKAPDWRILKVKPKDDGQANQGDEPIDEDDIPF